MKKTILTLAVMLTSLSTQLFAQQRNTGNLIENPGFEDGANGQDGWSISPSIWALEAKDKPKAGIRSLRLNAASSGYVTRKNDDASIKQYAIEGADSFNFSYWYRGSLSKVELQTRVRYYTKAGDEVPKHEMVIPGSSISSPTNDWQLKEIVIPTAVPNGAEVSHIAVLLEFKGAWNARGAIDIDELSLSRAYSKPLIEVNKPSKLEARAHERELELTWEGSIDPEISWEVEFSGKKVATKSPSYILTGLEPGREYLVKVVAKKEDVTSEAAELKTTTRTPNRSKDDEARIPYLRTLQRGDGQARKTIDLFYNDLHNGAAKMTYWVDGTEVKPTGHQLTFPSVGKHSLKIQIEESANEVWILNYNLQIND
ncbi:MAG: fibronectin type III domain-containing protein [Porphyromonadaceae bacterium]|nr:fibronectin type III domain-containing protein [Porphyromonadaceae bacterium]